MVGINLHDIVRPVVTFLNPDEDVVLYQSDGSKNIKGQIFPIYLEPQIVQVQVQTATEASLYHTGRAGETDVTRNFYLYSKNVVRPAGLVRPFSLGGDIFKRGDDTWWLVLATPQTFSPVGWICLRCSLQTIQPDFSYCDWYDPNQIV